MDYVKIWKEALKRHEPVRNSEWFKQQIRGFVWSKWK